MADERVVLSPVDTSETIRRIIEYADVKNVPWKKDYEDIIKKCYDFKELRGWESDNEKAQLAVYNVPPISVDHINRSLDTINGILENTDPRLVIEHRGMGDERVAELLQKSFEWTDTEANFDRDRRESFDSMKITGLGLRKLGFDPSGEGKMWCESIDTENSGWSYTRKKDFSNIRWIWHENTIPWEDAVLLNPAKEVELNSLKTTMGTKWDEINTSSSNGVDYNSTSANEKYTYPDMVKVLYCEIKKGIPYKVVVTMGTDGMPVPQKVDINYTGEEPEISRGVDEVWYEYVLAYGNNKKDGVLLVDGKQLDQPFHSYVPMVAEFKKNGQPMGFVEYAIPHQVRINLAWASKTAWNNKTIKSPLVLGGASFKVEDAIVQTAIGPIVQLPPGVSLLSYNQAPQANLQSIEEGDSARRDMDFAVAASEPVMTGLAGSSSSGIQLQHQQSAAMTPITKWVRAYIDSEKVFASKVLWHIIKNYNEMKMMMIVGEERFLELSGLVITPDGQLAPNPMAGMINPVTNNKIPPPIQFPLSPNIQDYDVVIKEQAISNLQKQEAFNTLMSLTQTYPFDPEYIIMHSPIKNPEEAVESNRKARADIINALTQENEMLKEMLGEAQKAAKGNPNAQGNRGKVQSQAGKRKSVGGQTRGMESTYPK